MEAASGPPPGAGPVEPRRHARRPRLALVIAVGAWLPLTGCVRGSLATGTGPNGPKAWSADNHQQAHVGEQVRFSFILIDPLLNRLLDPYGYADYCMATVGEDCIQCEPDLGGRFRFEHRLTGAEPGQTIRVTASAYRQRGRRDFMRVGDTWLRGESRFDEPDRKFRSDSLFLHVYQSLIRVRLPAGQAPFDFEGGDLRLIKSDGTVSPVYLDRAGRPGFTVEGPDQQGAYTIVYLPKGTELDACGQTDVRFMVHDLAGQPHSAGGVIPTP